MLAFLKAQIFLTLPSLCRGIYPCCGFSYHGLAGNVQNHSPAVSLRPRLQMSRCSPDISWWVFQRFSDSTCIKYNLRCVPFLADLFVSRLRDTVVRHGSDTPTSPRCSHSDRPYKHTQILSLLFNTFLLFPIALRPKTPDLSKVAHTLSRLGLASLFPSREHVVF